MILEVAAIFAYVELTRTVLYPYAPSRYNLCASNIAGFAISHVVPGGTAPAGALSYRIFNELGVPKDTNAFGLAVQGTGSAVVLNMIFWLALVDLDPAQRLQPRLRICCAAGVFLLLAFFGTILLITRGQRQADEWLRMIARRVPAVNPDEISALSPRSPTASRLLVNNRRTLWAAFMWASLNWLLDAACLWVFIWSFGR